MTLKEYQLRWKGYLLAFLDKEYFLYLEAFTSRTANATNDKGEYIYRQITDVYDREKRHQEIFGKKTIDDKQFRLSRIAQNLKEYRMMKGE